MKRVNMRFLLLLFSLLITTNVFAQDKLIFAIDVIRHGDRTPISELPTVSYHWPQGLGQLTATGMHQEYMLGAKLRKIYVEQYHLLPENYSTDTMYVRSTDFDRTLMSAESFLSGLYPADTGPSLPNSTQSALPNAYQPVPIHTVPKNQDNLLLVSDDGASFKSAMKAIVYPTPLWQKKTAELQPYFARWSKATGVNITNLAQLGYIGDTLYINQLYQVPLPPGLTEADVKNIIAAKQFVFVTAFKLIGQKGGENLLKNVAQHLQQASLQKEPLKYILYSAHDSTLSSVMSAMHVPLDEMPPYASDLNILLFDKGQKNYYVKISFNGKPVKIPGCDGEVCSVKQFVALIS
jgi:lysosomal acid phosphatase